MSYNISVNCVRNPEGPAHVQMLIGKYFTIEIVQGSYLFEHTCLSLTRLAAPTRLILGNFYCPRTQSEEQVFEVIYG